MLSNAVQLPWSWKVQVLLDLRLMECMFGLDGSILVASSIVLEMFAVFAYHVFHSIIIDVFAYLFNILLPITWDMQQYNYQFYPQAPTGLIN